MSNVTATQWTEWVAAHQAVEAAAEAAYRAYVDAPEFARNTLEARCEEIGRIYDQQHARLLGVEPPTVAAAAYQLRLFALGYHLGDPAEAPLPHEEQEIAVLRRIYRSLTRLADRAA